MEHLVLAYLPDLMWETRLRRALTERGAILHNVAFNSWPDSKPRLVIVAFGRPGDDAWEDLIIRAREQWPGVPIVAFGPHVALDARRRARMLGATHVLARGRFFDLLPALLSSFLSDDSHGCEDEPHPLLVAGVHLFNRGEFYECHEVLEDAWRSDLRPCRDLYQGILQLGVAIYHIQRGNHAGARKVLHRALRHLSRLPSECQGVDVATLRAQATAIQAYLASLETSVETALPPGMLPKVRIRNTLGG